MGFTFSAEHFANISSHQNSSVFIYQDAKATSNVSEMKFFFTPLFLLVSDNSGQPIVGVDGKTVEVLFQCFTQQLHNLVLNELKARLSSNDLKKNQISLIPITGIKIKAESEDVNSYIFPETGDAIVDLIPLSEQHEAKFKFADEEKAKQFAERIKNKKEDFYVELNIPSVSVTDDVIDIKASDFKKVDWKNFVNDKNADKNIDADNQYFTLDQLSDTFESILRRINITVVIESKEPGASQLTLDEKNKLLERFIEDLTKAVVKDLPPPDATEIFIGKESFKPDVINKEKTSTTEAMTSAFESIIDQAKEDIKNTTKWNSRQSLLAQLDKEYKNKKGSGSFATNVNVFKIFGGSSDGTANFDFTTDLENQMRQESKSASFDHFSSQTKERMRSELKNVLKTYSNFEWEVEGEKIIPKKIKLRRIISGEFKAGHQLFQRVRKIERSVSKIGFPISSNRNVIGLQEISTSTNTLELTLDNTHTSIDLGQQLESLVARYQVVNVRFNLQATDDRLIFEWNHPFSIPENHTLSIVGPHGNNPPENSLRVQINMTKTPALSWHGTDDPGNRRLPGRVFVQKNATLQIAGVTLFERANDKRELSMDSYGGGGAGALFNVIGDFGTVILEQSHVKSTEDIVSFGPRTYGSAKFGHTYVNKHDPTSRNILIVKVYTGWNFAGAGGVVSRSNTNLGEGVSFHDFPGIIYLN
jgi:hypothetical protein